MKTFLIIFGSWIVAVAVAFFLARFFNLQNREYRKIMKSTKSTILAMIGLMILSVTPARADIVGKTYVGQVENLAVKIVVGQCNEIFIYFNNQKEPDKFIWNPIFPPAFYLIEGFGVFQVGADESYIKYLPSPGYVFKLYDPWGFSQPYIDPAPYFVIGGKK